jgi:hypothetical protein
MKKKYVITIFILTLIVNSCDKLGECGADIKLGEVKLNDDSKNFIPYTGNEELIFIDHLDIKHRLKSLNGRKLVDSRSITKSLCLNGLFDSQYEYYKSQSEEIVFTDSYGNQIFWINLSTDVLNDENTNENNIYDLISVNLGVYNSNSNTEQLGGELRIITREIQGQLNQNQMQDSQVRANTIFIGDTILYNRNFENIYKAKTYESSKNMYYNKSKGLIAFGSINEFWVLDN